MHPLIFIWTTLLLAIHAILLFARIISEPGKPLGKITHLVSFSLLLIIFCLMAVHLHVDLHGAKPVTSQNAPQSPTHTSLFSGKIASKDGLLVFKDGEIVSVEPFEPNQSPSKE